MRILATIIVTACLLSGCSTLGRRVATPDSRRPLPNTTARSVGAEAAVPSAASAVEPMAEIQQVGYQSDQPPEPLPNASWDSSYLSAPGAVAENTATADTLSPNDVSLADNTITASDILVLNLPSALSLVGAEHPTVGFAQWRVQEAYAQVQQAKVMWLPTIQSGFGFHRHDGNYQASDGRIVDVNRNSFQYGLGTGATGAGTTPQPGILAAFNVVDAIYQPQIAERIAWARGHRVQGSTNDQLLAVALAYYDLVSATQNREILAVAAQRTDDLEELTRDFAEAGEGLQADADRLATEALLVRNRKLAAQESVETASASLAEAVSIRSGQMIQPLDTTATPVYMIPQPMDRDDLIARGLRSRPELKEAQALVAAACERYRRERKAPFIPSVLLGFSTGGFGGGVGSDLDNVDSRYDFDAVATWRLRNLGKGEQAARREAQARVQQARFQRVRVLDQVAREVSEAHAQVTHREAQIEIARAAVESAQSGYTRHLDRIKEGEGLPIEALQSLRSLEEAQGIYLRAIIAFNQAQFRLHWATGCPRT